MLALRATLNLLIFISSCQTHLASALQMFANQAQQSLQAQQQLSQAIDNNGTMLQALANMLANAAPPVDAIASSSNQFAFIKILQQDRKNNLSLALISHVSQNNDHEPSIDFRYQSKSLGYVPLDERVPNNTVVAAVVVNDPDPGPAGECSLYIGQGNELGHFKVVTTQLSITIQVNGAPLSRYRVPEYNLTLVARDKGTPSKSSSSVLVIKLIASNPTQMSINAPPPYESSLKPPVTDLMYVGATLVVTFFVLISLIIIGCALVQRPKSKKGPPPRSTSATNSRLHPSDHCLCVGLGLTNLSQQL